MCTMKSGSEKFPWRRPGARVALAMSALLLASYAQLSPAAESSQATFKSPEEASHALFLAVQSDDARGVARILEERNELVSSDDAVEDKLDRERFVQKYQQMHRFVRETNGNVLLYIGAENWPFPIPLVSRNGVWRFDSDAGAREVRFRQIGENEMAAIALCHALAAAKGQPAPTDEAGRLTATVLADGKSGNKPVPYHGYEFRVLTKSGTGFAAVAYPAAYRSSGVMSFIVNQDDVVYQKDLGPNTAKLAGAMAEYHRDATWAPAER
jgi:hypothetical protein